MILSVNIENRCKLNVELFLAYHLFSYKKLTFSEMSVSFNFLYSHRNQTTFSIQLNQNETINIQLCSERQEKLVQERYLSKKHLTHFGIKGLKTFVFLASVLFLIC